MENRKSDIFINDTLEQIVVQLKLIQHLNGINSCLTDNIEISAL